MKDKEEYLNLYNKYLSHEEESGDYLSKNALYIIHRTISRYSYEFQYDEDFFWIQDYSNANKLGTEVNRIIYFR